MKGVFISDCEGPISKNDNAYEMTSHFIPNGQRIFSVISRYDDVLADVLKKPGYKAGDTLKLILPFLKAYNVTARKMREFSARHLILIPNAKNTLTHVREMVPAYIVSTSYEQYIMELCKTLQFPFEHTYCTKVEIDKYDLTDAEEAALKETAQEIAKMPVFEIAYDVKDFVNLPEEGQQTVRRLDEIFWKEISCTDCGKMFSEVNPVGGEEKAEAIREVVQKLDVNMADVMYVGDSITDAEAFRLVKENNGLALAFNGNQYAIGNAEVAVMSEDSTVTAVLAEVFFKFGKGKVLDLLEKWNPEEMKHSSINQTLLNRLLRLHTSGLPKAKIITSENMETLARESSEFRRRVRGEAIGRLG